MSDTNERREVLAPPGLSAIAAGCVALWALSSTPAHAGEDLAARAGDIVVKVGAAGVLFDGSAKVKFAGNTVPGGSVSLTDDVTASAEIEYYATNALSLALNFGLPPKTRIDATGTLAPLGEAGRVRYGLGTATVRYHLNASGSVSPFVGAGVGHLFVFNTRDGSVSGLDADDAWAPVVQGGVDLRLSRNIGLYANVSYAPVKTDARGTVMGMPMTARVTLDPTVVQGGLSYRF